MKKALLIFTVIFSFTVQAQEYRDMTQRAEYYYKNDEFPMALKVYDSLVNEFPGNVLYLTRLGDCYMHTGDSRMAIQSYREAYAMDSLYSETIFKLGAAYDQTGQLDSAAYFFNRFIALKPEDPNGYSRLAITYMSWPGYADSAIELSKRGLIADPGNPKLYYVKAMAYLNGRKYVDAIFAAREGLKYDSTYVLLYMPLGIANIWRGNYKEADRALEKGMNEAEDPGMFVEYAAKARILLNTDEKMIDIGDENRIYFNHLKAGQPDKLLKEVMKEKSEYYYPDLLKKFNDHPRNFSLDEFYMLYLGFTTDKNYSPYFPENERLDALWNDKDYNQYLETARIYILEHPASFHIYLKMALAANYMGFTERHYEYMFKYEGFLTAVLATGTGKSLKESFVVCYPWHENTLMSDLGYNIVNQTLIKEGEGVYEQVTGEDDWGNTKEVYFNITIPYRELENVLDRR